MKEHARLPTAFFQGADRLDKKLSDEISHKIMFLNWFNVKLGKVLV